MERDRVHAAIARIETSLARVERAMHRARAGDSAQPDIALTNRHDALRQSVRASLAELDAVIGALGK